MKVVSTHVIPEFDIEQEKDRVQEILNEIDDKVSDAVVSVLKKHGIKGELLSTSKAGADDLRVVVADAEKILGVRNHNGLIRGTKEQEIVNKHWAILLRSNELHHPDDPNYK